MKILIVSNLYPPFNIGGYELRCSWVAEDLAKRGHDVRVVCSFYGCKGPASEPEISGGVKVYRLLHDYSFTHVAATRWQRLARIWRQLRDMRRFVDLVDDFRPEIINWWNLGGLCKGILAVPSSRGIHDVHWIEDVWMRQLRTDETGDSFGWDSFWQGRWGPRFMGILSKPLSAVCRSIARFRRIPFRFRNLRSDYACFSCGYQRRKNAGMRMRFRRSSVLIGCSRGRSFNVERDWEHVFSQENPLRLLYLAAITETRRLHTVLDALELMDDEKRRRFRLTVVGGPPVEKCQAYYDGLVSRVAGGPLSDTVKFMGQRPYAELPGICGNHDVFVFASGRPEGTPNAVLEAMMSGLCVVTTGSGGAGEIAEAARQPRFPVDNPEALKEVFLRLERNRREVIETAKFGKENVQEAFCFDVMMDKFEQIVLGLADSRQKQIKKEYVPLAAELGGVG